MTQKVKTRKPPQGSEPAARQARSVSPKTPSVTTGGAVGRVSNAVPKWMQIVTALLVEIEDRIHRSDLRLETEPELARKFGVSVVTVRQALSDLERRGLVARRRKLGTMIIANGLTKRTVLRLGAIADVIEQQKSSYTEILSRDFTTVPEQFKSLFAQQNVVKFVRCRYIGGTPANIATNYVRCDVAAEIDVTQLMSLPLTKIIHEQTRFDIGYVEQEITAEAADPTVAGLLNIAPLSPVIVLSGRTYDRDGAVLDVARIIYRGDGFALVHRFDVPTSDKPTSPENS